MRPARLSALPSSELKQFLSLLCTTVLYSIYYLFFQLFGSVVMFYYGDPCQPCSFFCNIFIFLIKAWSWLCSTIWCPAHPCRTVRCVPALPPVCPILPFSPPPRAFCCHCYSGSAKANWLTCRVKIIQHLYFFGIVVVFLNHMCYFFLEKNILLTHLLTCSGVSYSYH